MAKFKSAPPKQTEDIDDGHSPVDPSKIDYAENLRYQIHRLQNLNPDFYHTCYFGWNEKIQSAQGELRKIIDEKTSPRRTFASKKEEVQYFQHRIDTIKNRLARIKTDHEGLWLFVHESPLKIPGVLFNPELAVDLQSFREALKKLFNGLGKTRHAFESRLKETDQLVTVCEALALSKETPCVTSTGLIASVPAEAADVISNPKPRKKDRRGR